MCEHRRVNYFGDLASCGIVTWAEGAVTVSANDAVVVGSLDILVEGMIGRYIRKGGGGRYIHVPAFGQHNYLA